MRLRRNGTSGDRRRALPPLLHKFLLSRSLALTIAAPRDAMGADQPSGLLPFRRCKTMGQASGCEKSGGSAHVRP
jgi:hypothetical protein